MVSLDGPAFTFREVLPLAGPQGKRRAPEGGLPLPVGSSSPASRPRNAGLGERSRGFGSLCGSREYEIRMQHGLQNTEGSRPPLATRSCLLGP
jgi:hypothetical protein